MQSISTLELRDLQQNLPEGAVIIDVRSREEFGEGHLEDAMNIPVYEIAQAVDMLAPYSTIILYCASGPRTLMAAMPLEAAGKEVKAVASGGINEWKELGLPLV